MKKARSSCDHKHFNEVIDCFWEKCNELKQISLSPEMYTEMLSKFMLFSLTFYS